MREARKTQSSLRETWLDLDHAKSQALLRSPHAAQKLLTAEP